VLGAKPVQSATVYTTNPTQDGLGSDPGLHVERSAINPLSHPAMHSFYRHNNGVT
jgi:hypothetical protein